MFGTRVLPVLLTLLLTLSPGLAWSQTAEDPIPAHNLQRWRPSPNPSDYLTVYGTNIDEHLRLTGGFYLNYGHDPLLLRLSGDAERKSYVNHQFFADLLVSMAFFDYAELGLVLPIGFSTGSDLRTGPYAELDDAMGVGDMRVVLKGRILDLLDFPVGLAIIADLGLPTGKTSAHFGDDSVSFDIRAAIEFNPFGKSRFAGNLGYRYRPTAVLGRYTLGQALLLSGAAAIPFFHPNLDLLVEVHGEITVTGDNAELVSEERPVEAEIGFRYRLWNEPGWARGLALTAAIGGGTFGPGSPSTRVVFGLGYQWVAGGRWAQDYDYGGYLAEIEPCPDPDRTPYMLIPEHCREVELIDSDGDTIPDRFDRCPFQGLPGFIDDTGCPLDTDGDTIPDHLDKCPREGRPGLVDPDGCPIRDRDGDTIPDHLDKCPDEPGLAVDDGCPVDDPTAKVILKAGKLDIREQVFFETAKDKILSESFPILDEVAKVLNANPNIGAIDIEGHTDDRGKYDYNKDLSQRRAASVRTYLISKGVDGDRLQAIGYGPDRPIDTNDTPEGRARNRRVEFTIRGVSTP